jgi:hypothetical protein
VYKVASFDVLTEVIVKILVFRITRPRGFWADTDVSGGGGACGIVVRWGTMLQAGRSRDRIPMRWIFWIYLIQPHYGAGVDSASNRNEYQEYSWG